MMQPGQKPHSGAHLIVLVHGFQGNSWDMHALKNNLALVYPKAIYLCSAANEQNTEVGFETMGTNLAEEVTAFVHEWEKSSESAGSWLGRLTFVCHSIGGLVVRSALPRLQEFRDKFFTYVSLSSPHLGYRYPSNTLFQTGLYVAKKLSGSMCLSQLSFTDSEDPEKCYLLQLTRMPGLEYFQHVVLVSSYQDQYAPFESTRIEMSGLAENDAAFGSVYKQMVQNVMERIIPDRLLRLDVNFHIPETNLDTMIGRTAHIRFIECPILLRMFIFTYGFLFE